MIMTPIIMTLWEDDELLGASVSLLTMIMQEVVVGGQGQREEGVG